MKRALLAVSSALLVASCAGKRTAASSNPDGSAPTAYELRLGKETFRLYCQTCHGETGAGDGFNAYNLDPHPRDISDPVFQKKKSDTDLADVIRRGGTGAGLSSLMPPWGRTLSEAQIHQVILHIRTLKKAKG